MHPIFSVLVRRPELVMDHVAGYATLLREEASTTGHELARRAIAWGVAVLGFIAFLVLSGVAAMLAAMHESFHWALVLVPAIALAIAVGAAVAGMKSLPAKAFSELRAQLDADTEVLRAAGART